MSQPAEPTVPVPDSLLVPLLDAAATTFAGLDTGDVPAALRPLSGFDRRKLTTSGTARQQLRRAFDVDEGFRAQVVERFRDKPEVAAALDGWNVGVAVARAEDAAARADLPLLASTLYALRPEGWTFGVGAVCAAAELERSEQEREDDAKAGEIRLASAEEARRRAEVARDAAVVEASRLEEQLREERRARQERESRALADVEDADRRRRDAELLAEHAQAAATEAEGRLARESERARDAEKELRALRRELDQRRAEPQPSPESVTPAPSGTLPHHEIDALATAAETARHVAASLEGLVRRARDAITHAPTDAPSTDAPSTHAAATDATDDQAEDDARTTTAAEALQTPAVASSDPALPRRTRALCPPGMRSDTPEALDAMLRTRGVVLVVDGYNVSMKGWGDAGPTDQRERLIAALERLHLRVRCDVVVIFDGSDVEHVPTSRRTGVRVRFSSADEEADPLIVREVQSRPRRVPVIVASSDQWVHDHAEAEGATVVPAQSLLDVLRR